PASRSLSSGGALRRPVGSAPSPPARERVRLSSLLPLRGEARIIALALGRHVDELLVRLEALAVFSAKLLAQCDEFLRAHHVDVGERAARIGRIAKAEDRADIRFAHVG